MAIANAGTVQVDFSAQTAQFTKQLQSVNRSLQKTGDGFQQLETFARRAIGFLSVGLAVRFVQSEAAAADEASKLADKLGLSTERLAAFQLAAADAGVSQEQLNKLLIDGQRRLGDASRGTGEALQVIRSLGLSVRDLQKLSPDQLFLAYADALGKLNNRSEQFSAAQALIGRSATEAFTLIEAGRPAIEAAARTVDQLGLALSRVDASKIETANDKLGLLSRATSAFGQQIAASIAPFVQAFADSLIESGTSADSLREKIDKVVATGFFAFQTLRNGVLALEAAFFGVAAAGAKYLEIQTRIATLGFENDVSRAFRASAEENVERAKGALDQIQSFAQIAEQYEEIITRATQRAEEAARTAAERNAQLAAPTDAEIQIENVNATNAALEELQTQHFDRMLDIQLEYAARAADLSDTLEHDIFVQQQDRRVQTFIEAEQAIFSARQQFNNAAIGLLQTLAGKSKAAAIALVLINRGRAIAEAIQNTEVAATKALAFGDPYTAAARAAAIRALGYASVAAIAATGFAEIQNIRSSPGGASLGSPQNPVFTDTSASGQPTGANQRAQINVTVQGVITDGAIREIADALKDVIDNSDVHIIGTNSSQAQELRG